MGQPLTPRDPAASMALLGQILDSALDPAYRRVAEAGERKLPWWEQILVVLVVAALAFASVQAIKNLRFGESEHQAVRSKILSQVEERQESISLLNQEIESLNSQVGDLASSVDNKIEQLSPALSVGASLSPVQGPGVAVTIEDAPGDAGSKGIVRDADLQAAVNLLWESGAEAMAVNGVRLGSMTTIRTAGSVILVDLQPVATPYEVTAIGDGAAMADILNNGDASQQLKSLSTGAGFPIRVDRVANLTLPGTPVTNTKYAEALTGGGDAS